VSSKLLENYLTGHKQQIKLQGVVSGWEILQKGVPKGSIMRPLLAANLLRRMLCGRQSKAFERSIKIAAT
jgi:hypothetical protein